VVAIPHHVEEYHSILKQNGVSVCQSTYLLEWKGSEVEKCFTCEFPQGKESLVVQPFWTGNVSSFKCHDDVEFCAPFSHKTLVSRKPDVIIKKKGQDPVPFNVIAVGKLEGSEINKDVDEHLGRIEHYLSILLKQQSFRYRALGFLTNHRVIHVVEAQKVDLPIPHVKFV